MPNSTTVEARLLLSDATRTADIGDLGVFRVIGRERISQLYAFEVDFVVHAADGVGVDTFLGAAATLVFVRGDEEVRRVRGIIATAEQELALEGEALHFRVSLVPRMHGLTLVKLQDIFTDLSLPDLLKSKLDLYELKEGNDFELNRMLAGYPPRDFVVQFDETDLAFISRLSEHLGVSFFFEETDKGEKVVFSDDNGGFLPMKGAETTFVGKRPGEVGVQRLRAIANTISSSYGVQDYNYRTPDVELEGIAGSDLGFAGGILEWGPHVKTPEEAKALATIRAQEHECHQLTYAGESNVCEMSAGHRFRLEGAQTMDLILVEVEHHLTQAAAMSVGLDAPAEYRNTFTAVLADRPFRPRRVTPKPRIPGLIGGIIEPTVPGEVDRYARIDEHGRYVVKFLFDAMQVGERKASHPVRKAQPTVGPDYGMHFPLRPGIEVIIAFINGDPDRPIIVGAVHNAKTPAHVRSTPDTNVIKTASGIRMTFKDN